HLLKKGNVDAVDQQIHVTVAIPVEKAKLASAASSRFLIVQPQYAWSFIDEFILVSKNRPIFSVENTLSRCEHQFPVNHFSLKKSQIALVIQHHQIHQAVGIPVNRIGSCSPLG